MSSIRERKRVLENIKFVGLRFVAVIWIIGFGYTSTKSALKQFSRMEELNEPWKMMREDFAIGAAAGKIDSNEKDPTFQRAKANSSTSASASSSASSSE